MPSNAQHVLEHYRSYDEEQRPTNCRANELEFYYTKRLLNPHVSSDSVIIEIGCGTGYYGVHFAQKCAHYTGVDLSPENIAAFQRKITTLGIRNVQAVVGNALSLPAFPDRGFDVVLCLGPMYHLPRHERLQAMRECYRLAKEGAVVAFSYINAIGAYMGWCINDESREQYPSAQANKSFLEHGRAYDNPNVFFLTSPEEMEDDARHYGFTVLKNRALDFFFAQSAINSMRAEQLAAYMELADRMNESSSCTGLADHALLICRK